MFQGDDGGGDGGRLALLRALDGWRRGFGEAPVVCQWGIAGTGGEGLDAVTTGMPGAGALATAGALAMAREVEALTVTVSTGDVDRHGDVVSPEGWRLESYRRNPVVLWAHNYRQPAIGRAPAVWQEGQALLARIEFAPTEFAGQVVALYRDGYQRGVSVGFRPLRFEERRDARSGAFLGIRFLEQELLEISAVPVPANRAALLRSEIPACAGMTTLAPAPANRAALLRSGDGGSDAGGGVMAGLGGDVPPGEAPAPAVEAVVALLRGLRG